MPDDNHVILSAVERIEKRGERVETKIDQMAAVQALHGERLARVEARVDTNDRRDAEERERAWMRCGSVNETGPEASVQVNVVPPPSSTSSRHPVAIAVGKRVAPIVAAALVSWALGHYVTSRTAETAARVEAPR